MKKIIQNSFSSDTSENTLAIALLILRVVIGAMMLMHGLGKLSMLLGNDPISFPDPLGIGLTASLALAVFAEVFCSIFLILGIATRISALSLIVTMLIAAFLVHGNNGFAAQELAFLYLLIYLVIAIVGAGKYSIDNWISKKQLDNFVRQNLNRKELLPTMGLVSFGYK
ncbi:DoxX family protein [Mesonia sp. MT50]|uniref:DoxX family protein n=1 Tax=Mesonia profundi TaxID=3070998 RepID=A0ABU1A2J5_9FLAO|nr:DoxX family protein [Mesonia profundi]MDQ7917849.1 DoxX family protein [Mesonia profundi]